MHLSRRANSIADSVTLALDARAKQMAAEGRDLVNMAVGEPDASAPGAVAAAAVAKVQSGNVRYTPAAGTPSLRSAAAEHLARTRDIPVAPEEVCICHSAKHAISGTFLAICDEGDRVLLPRPAWGSFDEIVRLAGGEPVGIPSPDGARPDLAAIERAATGARAILVNTPNNPSGHVWSAEELEAVTRIAIEHDLWLVCDEIYRRLLYEGAPSPCPLAMGDDVRSRTIVIDGASKTFAMTGYRIGLLCAPIELTKAVARIHSQATGSPNAVSQAAFEAVLREEPPEVDAMVRSLAERRQRLLAGLAKLGLETPMPRGAFYAFPDVAPLLDERGAGGFCEDLLVDEGVVIVPGTAFGADEHVRLSYAIAPDRIDEALVRLERFVATRR